MKKQEALNPYEVNVVETLVSRFSYSLKESVTIVTGYRRVLEKIGSFDNPLDWAEKLDEAMRFHITPQMWLNVL